MTFYLARHANKEKGDFFNTSLRHQDEPISAEGQATARKLADRFAGIPIAAIYVSAYRRTGQTAAELARRLDITPVCDGRINEIDNGLFDGMSEQQLREAYPAEWSAYLARNADFRFPEGETGQEAANRIAAFIEEKRLQHGDRNVLIVSHEGLIRTWMCCLMGLPVYRRGEFRVDFCGLLEMEYMKEYERWKLIRFNQACA